MSIATKPAKTLLCQTSIYALRSVTLSSCKLQYSIEKSLLTNFTITHPTNETRATYWREHPKATFQWHHSQRIYRVARNTAARRSYLLPLLLLWRVSILSLKISMQASIQCNLGGTRPPYRLGRLIEIATMRHRLLRLLVQDIPSWPSHNRLEL